MFEVQVVAREAVKAVRPILDAVKDGEVKDQLKRQLEADHVEAKAKGGASESGSARLLCRPHNDQHARETFGEAFMQAKKQRVVTGVASSRGGDDQR